MNTRFHKTWQGVWNRCTNPNADNWEYYGGRGITVCERWRSFEAFTADMYASYEDGLTIERLDHNGPYSPENCGWATQRDQSNNTRRNRHLTFQGRTQTIGQWAGELGVNYFALIKRVDAGWTTEAALTVPYAQMAPRKGPVTHDGRTLTLTEWSRETGIAAGTIKMRLRKGWTPERALTTPATRPPKQRVITQKARPAKPPRPPARPGRQLTFQGRTLPLGQWAAEYDVSYSALWTRLDAGWPVEQALGVQSRLRPAKRGLITYDGRTLAPAEWARITGIAAATIRARVRQLGWPEAAALGYEARPQRTRSLT